MPESSFIRTADELPLSNLAQLELLRGFAERGKTLRTRVRGFSMAPFIRDGDIITVSAINGRTPKVGEVVAFIQPASGKLAIHRIIAHIGEDWLLRGDNSSEPDGIIRKEQLIGLVTGVESRGRTMRFGLGIERVIIAWVVRRNLLPFLKKTCAMPRRMAVAFLYRLQDFRLYRALLKNFFKNVFIVEATDEDMKDVYEYLNPNEIYMPENPDPNVTNYVAQITKKPIGFIQLVRYPEPGRPMTGHWLFSLTVRARYRGLGIGESLTQRVIDRSVLDGASELLLLVYPDNSRALNLYHKFGFEQIVLPALEPQLESEKIQNSRRRIVMCKLLNPNR